MDREEKLRVLLGRLLARPHTPPPVTSGTLVQGNIDMATRPAVRNPDGTVSSVRSMSIGTDRGEVLIPTVSDDGRIMSDEEAIEQYRRTGRHLGVARDVRSANRLADLIHRMEAMRTRSGRELGDPR